MTKPTAKPLRALQLLSLKGQERFTHLLRSRPLASWKNIRVYATKTQADLEAQPKGNVFLGQIIPKKQFALAVDRNRVRRIARAHLRESARSSAELSLDVLLKINIEKRIKGGTPAEVPNADQNPHSKRFSRALRSTIDQAVSRLALQNTTTYEDQKP